MLDEHSNLHTSPANTLPITILLVDDDKFLLDMYSLKFKNAGLVVDVAHNGAEAMKKLQDGPVPNIILLDIIMPTMDGLELLALIRSQNLAAGATIVMLTNQADDGEKAKSLGVDGFIVKAMNIPSEVVRQVMGIYDSKQIRK